MRVIGQQDDYLRNSLMIIKIYIIFLKSNAEQDRNPQTKNPHPN